MPLARPARCAFCSGPNAYAFEGLLICPPCARDASVEIVERHGEQHAMLELLGTKTYLYTATIADASSPTLRARLGSVRATLALIGAVDVPAPIVLR